MRDHIFPRLHFDCLPLNAVLTSTGHKYPVPYSDFIFVTPRVVIVAKLNGNTIGAGPLHMAGLEDLPLPRRGSRKKRQKR